MKIMIVDDNAGIREMIRSAACTEKDTVMECTGGSEAVANYPTFLPDYVLMDIEMQPVDGFTATEKMYEMDTHAKIIFVTSHNTSAFRMKAKQLHALGFISKENLHEIRNIIQQ